MTYGFDQPRYGYVEAVELAERSHAKACGPRGVKKFKILHGEYSDSLGRFVLHVHGRCCNDEDYYSRIEISPQQGIVLERQLTPQELEGLLKKWLGLIQ